MSSFDKRKITKMVAKTVVMSAAGTAITKTLLATIPATKKLNAAEIIGAIGAWVVAEELEPHTDALVDDFYDRREAKKTTVIT